jgi:hypothetical protein
MTARTEGQEAAAASPDEEVDAAAAGALSDLSFFFGFDVDSEPESVAVEVSPVSLSDVAEVLLRLSVAYQPDPLKTMRGALRRRLATPLPHFSQVCSRGAEKLSRSS